MNHLSDLKSRLEKLKKLRADEDKLKIGRSQIYIDDLTNSIAHLQAQIGYASKHPNGVEIVNGV